MSLLTLQYVDDRVAEAFTWRIANLENGSEYNFHTSGGSTAQYDITTLGGSATQVFSEAQTDYATAVNFLLAGANKLADAKGVQL